MNKEYIQQIHNIDYNKNQIEISLVRDEWNSVGTWIESNLNGTERAGKEWFQDLNGLIMGPISHEINFNGKDYHYEDEIPFKIPRSLLRYFIYSIGGVSYNLDVKTPTAMGAQKILYKINNQLVEVLSPEDRWWDSNF